MQLHFLFINLSPVAANLVILAINTGQITAAKKYITDTIYTADNRLFSMVNADRTDIETGVTSAYSNLSMQPVDIAISRTNTTRNQWFK